MCDATGGEGAARGAAPAGTAALHFSSMEVVAAALLTLLLVALKAATVETLDAVGADGGPSIARRDEDWPFGCGEVRPLAITEKKIEGKHVKTCVA